MNSTPLVGLAGLALALTAAAGPPAPAAGVALRLDRGVPYFVHCRSGNRTAQAVAAMREAGFSDVTDLGSLEQASTTTGLPIEQ